MRTHWDLVIIGSGPAGMTAALEAAGHGLTVLVLDRQAEPGGQIFRGAGEASSEKRAALGADYARGYELVRNFRQVCQPVASHGAGGSGAVAASTSEILGGSAVSGKVAWLGGAQVWHLEPGRVYFSRQEQSHCILARQILIATGGMERPVPLPGWTLPGVMGAGASDVLLKSASLLPEGPVILCGNGPLLLQSAAHLKHFKVPVAGVVLTGDLFNVARAMPKMPGAFLRPAYMAHGMGMGLRMVFGARCYPAASRLSIEKQGGVFSVFFHSLGKNIRLEGATVLLHEGVVSETRITRLARLNHVWNPRQRYWHVAADVWGNTNLQGVRCAGDVAGVRGADAAMTLGRLAALDICRELGCLLGSERDVKAAKLLWKMRRFNAMQPFMDTVFAPRPEALQPADEAVVCRCEELTAKELRAAILEGSYSPDGLKSQARPGMGACQGRMCSAAVAEMIAQAHNIPLERLESYHAQPPLYPLRLGELAEMSILSESL